MQIARCLRITVGIFSHLRICTGNFEPKNCQLLKVQLGDLFEVLTKSQTLSETFAARITGQVTVIVCNPFFNGYYFK
jgi:serine/threonine protein kinase